MTEPSDPMCLVVSDTTSTVHVESLSHALAETSTSTRDMHILCLLSLLWSLLCNLLSVFFRIIIFITQRFLIVEESKKDGLDIDGGVQEPLLSNENETEQEMTRLSSFDRCMTDESVEFELPPIARVSDVEMETAYPVSALFLKPGELPETSTQQLQIQPTRIDTDDESKVDLEKELPLSPPKRSASDSDSDNEFGHAAIQRQLIFVQKMKMDQKPPKKRGLPTILEDRESQKVAEDMKPLKLNNVKVDQHKDLLEQVHSFHKVYVDKMRKLDILYQQTLNALSFMGLGCNVEKDIVQKKRKKMLSITFGVVRSAFDIKHLCARVNCDESQMVKSSGSLMSKLEQIYVGQLCLSWEILNWQYSRAMILQTLDLQASHLYNQVADEFKQFQVTLQRFVENEASQGPTRVRSYLDKRAAFSGFLQVPLIKDDSLTSKKLNKGECFVTISSLAKIIDECRRVFYEFIREKKHGGTSTKVVPHDQSSVALLYQAQAKLHKKKKRIRELERSSLGGIVKMIRHTKEQPWLDQELFDARVELKLVARVLRMSEISREQIQWCDKKLEVIKLDNMSFHTEPTFLLFPYQIQY